VRAACRTNYSYKLQQWLRREEEAGHAPYKINFMVESTGAKRQTKEKKGSQQNRVRSDPDFRRAQGWDLPLAGLFHFTLQEGACACSSSACCKIAIGRDALCEELDGREMARPRWVVGWLSWTGDADKVS
jgi:hypothetical protein